MFKKNPIKIYGSDTRLSFSPQPQWGVFYDFEELVDKISLSRKLCFCWVIDSVIFEATLSVWGVFTRNALS